MTTTTSTAPSKPARYLEAPKLTPLPMPVRGPGCGEIRAHNIGGIYGGLTDLLTKCKVKPGPGKTIHRILITYLPVEESSSPPYQPKNFGMIRRVLVMATLITSTPDDYRNMTQDQKVQSVLAQTWYLVEDMHMQAKAEQIKNNALDLSKTRARAQFGNVMEPLATAAFHQCVLKQQGRWRLPDTRGGSGQGTDLRWRELAGLYGELARELGSPFFAELAAELATYGETRAA